MLSKLEQAKIVSIDTETYSDFNATKYIAEETAKLTKVTKTKLNTIERKAKALQKAGALNTLTNKVRLLQLAFDGEVYIFDRHNHILKSDFTQLLYLLSTKILVGHNLKFDIKTLYKYQPAIMNAKFVDTMLLHKLYCHANYAERMPADFGSVLEYHLDIKLPKDQGGSDWGAETLTQEQLEYAKNDVIYTQKLAETILAKVEKPIARLEFETLPIVAQIELNGIAVNSDILLEQAKQSEEEFLELEHEFISMDFNPRSPKQVLDHLHKHGYMLEKTGAQLLKSKAMDCPLVPEILRSKKLSKEVKAIRGYHDDVDPIDNRLHASLNQLGAHTGRFSSSKPNIQQIPRNIKHKFYRIEDDEALVKVDYSACQLRIASVLMKDKVMQEAFLEGKDIHKHTASLIWNIPFEEVTKEQRQTSKGINFGLIFGAGARTLQTYVLGYGVEITLEEANFFRDKFFQAYKGIQKFHRNNGDRLQRENSFKTYTLSGRVAKVDGYTNSQNEGTQGSEADIMKLSLVEFTKIASKPYKMINIIHDEFVFTCKKVDQEQLTKELQETMNHVIDTVLEVHFPNQTEAEVFYKEDLI